MQYQKNLKIITEPSAEPVSVSEAKTHLRITTTDEDTYITTLIKVARQLCEYYTNRRFIDTTLETYFDVFEDTMYLYGSPANSFTHLKYYDSDGVLQTVATDVYNIDLVSTPARIVLAGEKSWPSIQTNRPGVIVAKYISGYGSSASGVPEKIKQAILLMVANYYEVRQDVVVGTVANKIPVSSQYLLDTFKIDSI